MSLIERGVSEAADTVAEKLEAGRTIDTVEAIGLAQEIVRPMTGKSESGFRWIMGGRFAIEADSEEEADRAMAALERAAKRVTASVNLAVHVNEAASE